MWKRLFGWWFLAEDALRVLSAPRPDVRRTDREVDQLFRESWLFTAGRGMAMKAGHAWADSRAIAAITTLGADLFPPEPAARVRVVGVLAFVASVTGLGVQALKPISLGPLTWIVPALTAAAGVVVALAAAPIARALEDKAQ
jgi:hypothetical protein